MKRFLPVFGLLPVLIVPAWASDLGLTAIMRTHKMSALEAAAVVVIADALHVNADFVISTGRGSGVSPVIYGPAYIYSYRTHQDFDDVWRKRKMGWGEIAHSIGMHPGTFNKLRRQGYSVDQIIWMDTLNRRYRIPYSDYSSWRKGGNSDGRILEVVARNDGNLAKINAQFSHGGGKGVQGGPGHGNGPGMGKGKGHGGGPPKMAGGPGNGRGHGKGHGKGKGNGGGDGSDGPGMGHGHGHGNGNGNGHGRGG